MSYDDLDYHNAAGASEEGLYRERERERFADPGGNSALRAETRGNPRNLPCPTCCRPNMLTPADKRRGYQCDICADETEMGY